MKKYFLLILLVLLFGGYALNQFINVPKETHMHAGFQVYVDDKLQDFSDIKYMSIKPCKDDDHQKKTKEEIQDEKAHLHDEVGDVVHSHREGGTWGDLFKNIDFKIDSSKEVKGYIDGNEVTDIFRESIKPYQSVVILIGSHANPDSYLEKRVKKERIVETEKKSEDCGVN